MMRNPIPEACFLPIETRRLKISNPAKPEGFTPFGRISTPARNAAAATRISPEKSSTICVW